MYHMEKIHQHNKVSYLPSNYSRFKKFAVCTVDGNCLIDRVCDVEPITLHLSMGLDSPVSPYQNY